MMLQRQAGGERPGHRPSLWSVAVGLEGACAYDTEHRCSPCVPSFLLKPRPEVKSDFQTVRALETGRAQEEARGKWHLFWVVKWLLVKYDKLKHLFAQPPYRTNKNCKKNRNRKVYL